VDAFGESQSKISYHLKQLLDVGLIERRSHGTWAYYSLTGDISRWARGGMPQAPEPSGIARDLAALTPRHQKRIV